eukprot:tig00021537_g22284.t1
MRLFVLSLPLTACGRIPPGPPRVEDIRKLFPRTFGQRAVRIVPNSRGRIAAGKPLKVPAHRPRPRRLHLLQIGVVFSGGPAPGGHNVVCGLLDFLRSRNRGSELIGFLDGRVPPNRVGAHEDRDGGAAREGPRRLVVVGGDDSNTNAAVLAEYFIAKECPTRVIGVPKTIDGDLRNEYVECSFGFDTACKLYSETIANLAADCAASRRAWHFVRLMGRAASHITLECALQTHPNVAVIGEEVEAKGLTLQHITREIADAVCRRSARGLDYGLVLLPEGLIDWMPDVGKLVRELNELLARCGPKCSTGNEPVSSPEPQEDVRGGLSPESAALFNSLPGFIERQLLLDRDPHGNVQVSKIESERLLVHFVQMELAKRRREGSYGGSFLPITHFFGYEGRCALPSNFDCNYCYTLGHVAAALVEGGFTGMMAVANNLLDPVEAWSVGGMPLTHMMNMERRAGHAKPVIRKALVDLRSRPFKALAALRRLWLDTDAFRDPGAMQYSAPTADDVNFTLQLLNAPEGEPAHCASA